LISIPQRILWDRESQSILWLFSDRLVPHDPPAVGADVAAPGPRPAARCAERRHRGGRGRRLGRVSDPRSSTSASPAALPSGGTGGPTGMSSVSVASSA